VGRRTGRGRGGKGKEKKKESTNCSTNAYYSDFTTDDHNVIFCD